MALGICKTQRGISVKLDNGETRLFDYNTLKQMVLTNQINIANMYINEGGRLCFIPTQENDVLRKNLMAMDSDNMNRASNRKAGWHSGGDKKPYGFTHRM